MEKLDERNLIYTQMRLLLEDRRELMKAYIELKNQLSHLDTIIENSNQSQSIQQTVKKSLKAESDYQRYMLDKRKNKHGLISYQDISLKITSLLKESGKPLANKKILELLNEKYGITISHKNLTSNILPRINTDSRVNVERAYRGYWQYRLK